MSVFAYSKLCGIYVLFSITGLFCGSEHGCETTLIQSRSCENISELSEVKKTQNLSFSEIGVYEAQPYTLSRKHESTERTIRWNNMTLSAREFQNAYCSTQCHGNLLVTPQVPDLGYHLEFFPCDCTNRLCEFYGTCCPDYYKPSLFSKTVSGDAPNTTPKHWLGSIITGKNTNFAKGMTPNVFCDGPSKQEQMSARSCPLNYPDDDVKSKCQDDIPSTEQAIDTFLHVADNTTGLSFYNQYCAACHNVQQFTPWYLSMQCFSYMTLYTSRTPEELFQQILAKDSDCIAVQTPPAGLTPYSCDKVWFHTTIIDTCNVTGEWDEYDEDIAQACENVSGLVNRVRDVARRNVVVHVYKNLFCAMCNKKVCTELGEDSSQPDKTQDAGGSAQIRLPFSVLLNFGSWGSLESQKPNLMRCSQSSDWTSPDNKCLPLQCSPGKILTNGNCTTAFNQIRGLVYQIHAVYVPISPIVKPAKTENSADLHSTYLDMFTTVIENVVYLVASKFQITVTMTFSNQTFPSGENAAGEIINTTGINCCVIDGYIKADALLSRDEMETLIVRKLLISNITVYVDTNTTLTFVPTLHPQQKYPDCSYRDKELLACLSSGLPSNRSNLYDANIKETKHALIVEPHLFCPFVQFDNTEYVYVNENTGEHESVGITVFFKNAKMTFYGRNQLNMASIEDNGTLRICLELLNTTNVIRSEFTSHSLVKLALYVLTLMCVNVSIICLAVTLMTYFLFPVLRSLAGKNNMFLCGSLLLAQISLLATSHVQETGCLCTILAICTHFLWLSMFCWCFTCCYHMFCVFSAKTRSIQTTAISEMVYIIKRVVACVVIPVLIITGVIATHLTISGGEYLGYGKTTCFIDSQITLIIALVAPLCLVLLFNFTFFSITVVKIYQVRKLQTREFRKDGHNNLYIYIKLSSMTGIFWVLSVISEATDNDPLRFISIGLNGLQGVFIFLSYICNRRVLKLYLKLLGLETYFPTTSTSDRSTIAKVMTDVDKQAHRSDDTETIE